MVGFMASGIAFQNNQVALGWLAFDMTGDTRALGFALFVHGVAMAVGSLAGGVIADRFNRSVTIIGLQVVMTGVALVMALLLLFDALELWHLYLVSAATGALMSLHMPSRQAFVYNIVGKRHLANAMALNMGTMNAMRLIGPGIAGVLIGSVGIEAVYFVTVAGFVVSIAVMLFYIGPTNQLYSADIESPIRSMADGFAYLWRRRPLFWMFVLAMGGAVLGIPFRDLLPAFAVDALGQGPEGYGVLLSMVGLGALIGSVSIASLARFQHRGLLTIGGGVGIGVLMIAVSFASGLGAALPLFLLLGWASTTFSTTIAIIIQTGVDDAFRGRMASIYMLTFSIHPAGALALGILANETGIAAAFMIAGLALLGFIIVMTVWRKDVRTLA
jgi:predicted MFS family arabinose efflux permease